MFFTAISLFAALAVAPCLAEDKDNLPTLPFHYPPSEDIQYIRQHSKLPPIPYPSSSILLPPPYDRLFETSPTALTNYLSQTTDGIVIVDVRDSEDYKKEHIAGALSFPTEKSFQMRLDTGLPTFYYDAPEIWAASYVAFYRAEDIKAFAPHMAMTYYGMSEAVRKNPDVYLPEGMEVNQKQSVVLLYGGLDEFKKDPENLKFLVRDGDEDVEGTDDEDEENMAQQLARSSEFNWNEITKRSVARKCRA